MATVPLPERPDLGQLRRRARKLQRAVRAGDPAALVVLGLDAAAPAFPLGAAQRALARSFGFASWARLKHHVEQIQALTWPPADQSRAGEEPATESAADLIVRLACLTWADDADLDPAAAERVLATEPELPLASLAVAAVVADEAAIEAHLRRGVDVCAPCGPLHWSPLMYVAYSRFEVDEERTLATARALLAAGANPNDGRYFQGYPTPFTVLTGVFGDGEGEQPRHRWSLSLARLLLTAGADPNDGQTMYNRQFGTDDDFLHVLFEFGLGRGDGGPWRRRLPDLTPAPSDLVRILLDWAVTHDQRSRVALLAANGVDVLSPLPSGAWRSGRTPIELALANGHRELAGQLRALGAVAADVDPVETFVRAALAGDRTAVTQASPEQLAAARRARPALAVWAAGLGRIDAVELLLDAGFDPDALGRGDVPVEQPWQTALHTAVERDNASLVQLLLERGADLTIRDARFDSTALGWAEHLGRSHLVPLLTGAGGG
jgi:ankyrin repeat protein